MKIRLSTRSFLVLLVGALAVSLSLTAGPVDGVASVGNELSLQLLERAKEASGAEVVPPPSADAEAWSGPTANLDRAQAVELLGSVFGGYLEATSKPLSSGLEVDHYLGNHAALVTVPRSGDAAGSEESGHALLESSIPLRVSDGFGGLTPVDLSLEREGEAIQPSAPLVPVSLPQTLGAGIQLPSDEVTIELAGAPDERSASIVNGSAADYPNVAADTDFVAVPTPIGAETISVLRSAAAPSTQTLKLDLPAGAKLIESPDGGGAEVRSASSTLLRIPPPTAIDASGEAVPVSMQVEGPSLRISADPPPTASYPILVDPLFESYDWYDSQSAAGQNTWSYSSTHPGIVNWSTNTWLGIEARNGSYIPGDRGAWSYFVPRLKEEEAAGRASPTSFISRMTLMHVGFWGGSTGTYSPYLTAGILGAGHWAGVPGHEAVWGYGGNMADIELPGAEIKFENGTPTARDETAKIAIGMAISSTENTSINFERHVIVGGIAIEVTDEDLPHVANGSISPWINESAPAITADAEDTGLGVKRLSFQIPGQAVANVTNPCLGTVTSPCPYHWNAAVPAGGYNASALSEGIDLVPITAEDSVGNRSPAGEKALLRVDHTNPLLAVSGSATEQAAVGTKLSRYTLNYNASDGDSAEASASTPLGAVGTGPGQLEGPMGVAVDASGNVYEVDRENNRIEKFDPSGKLLKEFGSFGTAEGFLNDPRGIAISPAGNIWVAELGNKRVQEFTSEGKFIRKIAYEGFQQPSAVATGPNETLWVTDLASHRLYRFREDGTLLQSIDKSKVGAPLTTPAGVAVDSFGNAWVTEQTNSKVDEFSPTGASLASFGAYGSENGQLNQPVGIAVAKSGNLLVADGANNRIQEFKPDGTFMRSFGSVGSGNAQLTEPRGIAVGPGNTLYVADAGNHRIAKWTHADNDPQSGVSKVVVKVDGQVVKEEAPGCETRNCILGGSWTLDANNYSAGSHEVTVTATDGVGLSTTEQLNISLNPAPPTLSLSGTITEQASLGTTRPRYVLEAEASPNSKDGESWTPAFIAAFGATGSGEGQLNGPRGVASDGKGHVWVVDRANNRVEEFNESGEYLGQFGSTGTGAGQFTSPWGIAVTPAGNIWVSDTGNQRVEEFSPGGKFIQKFGTKVAGESKGTELLEPEGIAVAPNGMLWVADCSGNRVAEFRENPATESERFVRNAAGTTYKRPVGVGVDASGNVWVAEEASNHLLEFNAEGGFVRSVGSFGSADGQLNTPEGVGVGPSGNVYVVDLGNSRVDVFSPEGKFVTKFGTVGTGNGNFSEPRAIAFGAGGAMFVSDKGNNRIHKWGAPWEGPPSFASAFGSTGSGEGQLNGPRGVASDGKGHVWVVDRANNRVEEFDETGKYLGQFGTAGSGNGQFNNPWGIAVTPAGNIWVADTGNQRLEEFNPKGGFIQKFGTKATAGSQGTELLEPEGVAASGNGMLWVTDCRGNRVAEFRETVSLESERFVRNATGTAVSSPVGVAVDGSGDVWVAEETANHLLEFDAEGSFVRQTGTTGSGNGQLSTPEGVGVGPSGDVYAVDLANNRVDLFNRNGQFLTKFGTSGTGNGNFSEPRAIAFGAAGAIFVSDKGNNRVHKWSQPVPSDQVAGIEVKVDGKAVGTTVLGCASSSCSMGRQWILSSPEYLGGHTVTVKATTVAGWTATKTLTVEEKRDEVKPTIQTGGELANAPEGWVQQESYGFTATAADPGGYGTTSLLFKIDGTTIASTSQNCREGGCEASVAKGINMAPYAGGSHQAEVLATDGAGNSATRRWTINVDPNGNITTAEATATMEAVEGTEPETTALAPTTDLIPTEEREEGNNPGLEEVSGQEFAAAGTPVEATVTISPEETAMTINGNEGREGQEAPFEISPVATTPGGSPDLVEGVAAVSSNTQSEADSVVRPVYNGLLAFQDIRGPSSPEEYSWEVSLLSGETLKAVDGETAAVYFENEIEMMLIEAMPAHDALGHYVPTRLSVTAPNVVTLTVEHQGGQYVYPVMAGPSFEVGYSSVEVVPPAGPDAEEEPIELWQSPPQVVWVPDPACQPNEACASVLKKAHLSQNKMRKCQTYVCAVGFWEAWLEEGFLYNGEQGKIGGQAWHDTEYSYHHCNNYSSTVPYSIEPNDCTWIGNHAHYGYGHYMCAQKVFHVSEELQNNYHAETFHNFGDGYAGPHQNSDCKIFVE